MGKLWIAASVLALAVQSTAAAEHPLTIKVLKIERSARSSYLLLKVENASERRFERTTWSCVFFKGGQPVHEERTSSRRASCCNANSSVASSFMWLCEAVTTSMSRSAVKARLAPEIVSTRRATTMAGWRFAPPPATAPQAPRHCGGTWLRKGGV